MEAFIAWFNESPVIGAMANLITLVSAFLAAVASIYGVYLQRADARRRREEVKVYVRLDGGPAKKTEMPEDVGLALAAGKQIEVPLAMNRGDFTRAELMGRLGMLAKDQSKNLRIKAFASSELLRQVIGVMEQGKSSVTVLCDRDELDQIDLSAARPK